MKIKRITKVFLLLIIFLILLFTGIITYIYYSTPKIEKNDVVDSPIYLNVGQEKTIINDITPDASFLVVSVISTNPEVIRINNNKFSVLALKKGNATIRISSKGELIKEIVVHVV